MWASVHAKSSRLMNLGSWAVTHERSWTWVTRHRFTANPSLKSGGSITLVQPSYILRTISIVRILSSGLLILHIINLFSGTHFDGFWCCIKWVRCCDPSEKYNVKWSNQLLKAADQNSPRAVGSLTSTILYEIDRFPTNSKLSCTWPDLLVATLSAN